ncbi:DUF2000 family protein [Pedococcus bigeumensis]
MPPTGLCSIQVLGDAALAVYTRAMFSTGHDADNRAGVSAVLDVVGLGLHGPKNAVDKVIKGTRAHR